MQTKCKKVKKERAYLKKSDKMLVTTQTSSEVSDMLNLYYTEKLFCFLEIKRRERLIKTIVVFVLPIDRVPFVPIGFAYRQYCL